MNEVRKVHTAGHIGGPEGESGRRRRQLPLEMLIFNF